MSVERGWALRSIERGQAATGTGAHVNQPPPAIQGFGDGVNGLGDRGQRALYRFRDFLVLAVDDLGNLERGKSIQLRRSEVRALRPQVFDTHGTQVYLDAPGVNRLNYGVMERRPDFLDRLRTPVGPCPVAKQRNRE